MNVVALNDKFWAALLRTVEAMEAEWQRETPDTERLNEALHDLRRYGRGVSTSDPKAIRRAFDPGAGMTLDADTKQVVAVGLAYAIGLLERAPPHFIRPGLLYDLHSLLEKLTDDEPGPVLKVARAHAKKLVKEMVPTELH